MSWCARWAPLLYAYCNTVCPKLQGKLVPQQINLWMGAAQEGERCVFKRLLKRFTNRCRNQQHRRTSCVATSCLHARAAGSSTGLHTDFHDNL